jgi:hypothetical protein
MPSAWAMRDEKTEGRKYLQPNKKKGRRVLVASAHRSHFAKQNEIGNGPSTCREETGRREKEFVWAQKHGAESEAPVRRQHSPISHFLSGWEEHGPSCDTFRR